MEEVLMENPTVSVILSTYNRSVLLKETIESVLAQEYKDFELLVVDDGSTDDTKEVVLSLNDDRIKYIYQKNIGNSGARNIALKKSLGKYIASIDDDDLWTTDRLSHVAILDSEPDVDIVCCDCMTIDGDGNIDTESLKKTQELYQGNIVKPLFLSKLNSNLVQMMILRRECLDKAGLYDESIKYSSDTDLERRLSLYCNFQIRTEKFYKIRVHNGARLTDRGFEEAAEETVKSLGKFMDRRVHKVPFFFYRKLYSKVCVHFGLSYLVKLGDLKKARKLFAKAIYVNPFNKKAYGLYFSKKKREKLKSRQ